MPAAAGILVYVSEVVVPQQKDDIILAPLHGVSVYVEASGNASRSVRTHSRAARPGLMANHVRQ